MKTMANSYFLVGRISLLYFASSKPFYGLDADPILWVYWFHIYHHLFLHDGGIPMSP